MLFVIALSIALPGPAQLLPHIVSVVLYAAGGGAGPVPGQVGDHPDHVVILPLPCHAQEHPAIGAGEAGVPVGVKEGGDGIVQGGG